MTKANIGLAVLEQMPYTIASAQEFELASQVIGRVGIGEVMAKKTAPDQRTSLLLPFVQGAFREQMKHVDPRLFPDDFKKLMISSPA